MDVGLKMKKEKIIGICEALIDLQATSFTEPNVSSQFPLFSAPDASQNKPDCSVSKGVMGMESPRVSNRRPFTQREELYGDVEQDLFATSKPDTVILIAPVDHPWAKFRKIYPDDLLDEPMILREEHAGTREVLMEGLQKHDISPDMLNVAMVLGNAEAIEMAVEEGLGIAFVSRLAASRGLELGRIVEVEVEGMQLARDIYIVRNRKQPLTRAQTEFWQFIKDGRDAIKLQPIISRE